MSSPSENKTRYFNIEYVDPEERAAWNLQDGLISIAYLESLTGGKISSHYEAKNPQAFTDLIDWGTHMPDTLKGAKTPATERWRSYEDLPPELRGKLRVLSFEKPEIRVKLAEVSNLAQIMHGTVTWIEEQGHTFSNGSLDALRMALRGWQRKYRDIITEVMSFQIEAFNQNRKAYTVAPRLLRGAEPFRKTFKVPANCEVLVDAKRLDFGNQMMVGFVNWQGLEAVTADFIPGELVELAFVDDCGATFGSIESAVAVLQQKAAEGEFPEFDTVKIYVGPATQPGIVDLYRNMAELGVKVEVIAADIAYQLSDLYYLERAGDEKRPDGGYFKEGQPWVGDMGFLMTFKPEEIVPKHPAA